jgi:hypothetical protein
MFDGDPHRNELKFCLPYIRKNVETGEMTPIIMSKKTPNYTNLKPSIQNIPKWTAMV